MRVLRAAGWLALALGIAAAALILLPLQPDFMLPSVDGSFAATLHYAAAHRGEPGLSLISTYGPLGYVHYPLYFPETFAALVWWRLLLAMLIAAPLAWLGWAAGESPWGAALAVAASTPFLGVDDLRGVLVANLAVLVELVPRRRAPAALSAALGVALGVMALIKGTFLILAPVALVPATVTALRARRAPWMLIGALGTAAGIWAAIGLGLRDAAAFLDWSLREIAPGYAHAMQLPGTPALVAQAGVASAAMCLAGSVVARRGAPPRRIAAVVFGILLFLQFKVGFVRPDVHAFITIDLLIIDAVLLGLLWAGPQPWRVLAAALVLGALPAAIFAQLVSRAGPPIGSFRIATWRELRQRLTALPTLIDPASLAATHDSYAFMIRAGRPLPPLDGSVDVYPYEQTIALAYGLTLRPRPVFQSYMAYTRRLAHANAAWLASPEAAHWILFRPATLNNRLPAQDDGASWPLLLSGYDPVGPIGTLAVLERRATPRPWRLVALERIQATTGEAIVVPRAARLWARIDAGATLVDGLVGMLLAPPSLWVTTTYADGHTVRWRLVPELARDGLLLSPLVSHAEHFTDLLRATAPPPDRTVTEIRVDWMSPFGGTWDTQPVTVEFFKLEIGAEPDA